MFQWARVLPAGSLGRLDPGQSGSSAAEGSLRGTHIGYPVAERTLGFSASTPNRASWELARP
jgi:hypothetical protein